MIRECFAMNRARLCKCSDDVDGVVDPRDVVMIEQRWK